MSDKTELREFRRYKQAASLVKAFELGLYEFDRKMGTLGHTYREGTMQHEAYNLGRDLGKRMMEEIEKEL